jgi:hypothetical protein
MKSSNYFLTPFLLFFILQIGVSQNPLELPLARPLQGTKK